MDRAQARQVLGVPLGAPPADVDRAFRRAVRRAHPDAGGNPAAFRRVVEARAVLLGPGPVDPIDRAWDLLTEVVRHTPLGWFLAALARSDQRRAR